MTTTTQRPLALMQGAVETQRQRVEDAQRRVINAENSLQTATLTLNAELSALAECENALAVMGDLARGLDPEAFAEAERRAEG